MSKVGEYFRELEELNGPVEEPTEEAINSQLLYGEPKGLNIDTGLPKMKKERF